MATIENPLHLASRAEWRQWLQAQHAESAGEWLALRRAGAQTPGVTYEEALQEALCFGWIDGLMQPATQEYFYQRFTPRRPNSLWSLANQKRVARLIADGLMTEAGLARIQEAKDNGQWEAASRREDISNLPEDLVQALAENPTAQANFEKLSPSAKKQFLSYLFSAKTEKTRQKRLQETVALAAENRKLSDR